MITYLEGVKYAEDLRMNVDIWFLSCASPFLICGVWGLVLAGVLRPSCGSCIFFLPRFSSKQEIKIKMDGRRGGGFPSEILPGFLFLGDSSHGSNPALLREVPPN